MKARLLFSYLASLLISFLLMWFTWWQASTGLHYWDIVHLWYIPFIAAAVTTLCVWAIWNFEIRRSEPSKKAISQDSASIEKKKRERLDSVLRDLSDEDLLRLRRRLVDGTIDDSHLEDALLGEDGEILYGEKS